MRGKDGRPGRTVCVARWDGEILYYNPGNGGGSTKNGRDGKHQAADSKRRNAAGAGVSGGDTGIHGAEGVVGNTVQVSMSRVLIDGDADFDKLINQIRDLRMAVELVNGYEGKWSYVDPFDRGKDKEEKDA